MTCGKFITIEGTEGAGKSTALQFIKAYLLRANKDVVMTREPGGTEMAEEIRKVLLYKGTDPACTGCNTASAKGHIRRPDR